LHADSFIRDGSTILVYSFSRVVLHALLETAKRGKRFKVLVPESRPDGAGYPLAEQARTMMRAARRRRAYALLSAMDCVQLLKAGLPVTIIVDAGVAHVMNSVDIIMVGAGA
jgi:translation initiation factor eIF-2B subunit alpha